MIKVDVDMNMETCLQKASQMIFMEKTGLTDWDKSDAYYNLMVKIKFNDQSLIEDFFITGEIRYKTKSNTSRDVK